MAQHRDFVRRVGDLQLVGGDGRPKRDADAAEQVHFAVLGIVQDAAGQHIRPGRGGNDKGPAFEDAQFARLGARALGEDQHRRAAAAGVGDPVDRGGVALAAVDGHRAHAAQKPADEGVLEQFLLGQDAHAPPVHEGDGDIDGVQVADMVAGNDQRAAVVHGVVVLAPDDLDAPDQVRQHPHDGQNDPIQQHGGLRFSYVPGSCA